MKTVHKAEEIARKAHHTQKRWNGSPYIEHPKRVASSFDDDIYKTVGWLHDVLEDTIITEQDLIESGIPTGIINFVKTLTRREGETYYDFILRIKQNPTAVKVKIADIEDNINDNLKEGSLKDKYRLAKHVLEGDENESK